MLGQIQLKVNYSKQRIIDDFTPEYIAVHSYQTLQDVAADI